MEDFHLTVPPVHIELECPEPQTIFAPEQLSVADTLLFSDSFIHSMGAQALFQVSSL